MLAMYSTVRLLMLLIKE